MKQNYGQIFSFMVLVFGCLSLFCCTAPWAEHYHLRLMQEAERQAARAFMNGDLQEAGSLHRRALKEAQLLNLKDDRLANIKFSLAEVLYAGNQWAYAAGLYKEALAIYSDSRVTDSGAADSKRLANQARCLLGAGNACLKLHQIKAAQDAFKLCIEKYERCFVADTPESLLECQSFAIACMNLADIYTRQEQYEQALPLYAKALQLLRSNQACPELEHQILASYNTTLKATGKKPDNEDWKSEYALAIASQRKGDLDNALKHLELANRKLLAIVPPIEPHLRVLFTLSDLYYKQNKLDLCAKTLKTMLDLEPKVPGRHLTLRADALDRLALIAQKDLHWSQASQYLLEAVALRQEEDESSNRRDLLREHLLIGLFNFLDRKKDVAFQHYKKALSLCDRVNEPSRRWQALLGLGLCYSLNGNDIAAQKYYQEASQLLAQGTEPDHVMLFLLIQCGYDYIEKKDWLSAIRIFSPLSNQLNVRSSFDPSLHITIETSLAQARLLQDRRLDLGQSISHIRTLFKLNNERTVHSLNFVRPVLQAERTNLEPYCYKSTADLVSMLMDDGKNTDAKKLAITVIEFGRPPVKPLLQLTNALAQIYLKEGKRDDAARLLKSTWHNLKNYKAHDIQLGIICTLLGDHYKESGDLRLALSLYKRSVTEYKSALGPEVFWLYHPLSGMAEIYIEQGNLKEAKKVLSKAKVIAEKYLVKPEVRGAYGLLLSKLACIYYMEKNFSLAGKTFSAAKNIVDSTVPDTVPGKAWLYDKMGTFYLGTGKHAEASKLFEKAVALYTKIFGNAHRLTREALRGLNAAQRKTRGQTVTVIFEEVTMIGLSCGPQVFTIIDRRIKNDIKYGA